MIFTKKLLPFLIIFFLCLALILIWFKDGKLLATGEEGLMLINPNRAIELYKYSWNELGTGAAIPGSNPMVPLFYLESMAVRLGMQIWVFQAAVFFILMFIGAISIHFLTKEILRKYSDQLNLNVGAILAALFYILNPVSMLGVWYRFLLAFMFFYALAPLFFYLYLFGLNNKKSNFILIVPLIGLLFSFAFTGPSFILLLWLLPFIYTISVGLNFSKGKIRLKFYPFVYFFLSILFWILINLWWIFPYIELSKIAFVSETDPVHAIGTLKANSKDFILDNVLRLIHGGILYRSESFGSIYTSVPFLVLSWIMPVITFYGLIRLRSGLIKSFLITSLILLLFLAKGTSPPFGQVFLWFFERITFLQVYRNTFEKIGILLPIVYAPLFSYGLFHFLYRIRSNRLRMFFFGLAILGLGLTNWPFFTGAIVSYKDRDIRVEIPESFQGVNSQIPSGDHILLSLPVMGGASGFYDWKFGYKGVESSEYLFDYPVITKFYDAPSFLGQTLIGISNGDIASNLIGISQLFSADMVILRKDTDIKSFGYNFDALTRSEKMISEANLNNIFDAPELSLWILPNEKRVPVIYAPKEIRYGNSPQELVTLLKNGQFDPQTESFICINSEKCKPFIQPTDINEEIIESIPENITFKKLSPVRYEIQIQNSTGKFLLVFNKSFHPEWTLKNKDPNKTYKHIVANGYANGFIFDGRGDFTLILEFFPELKITKYQQMSYLMIILGVIVLLLLSSIYFIRKRVKS